MITTATIMGANPPHPQPLFRKGRGVNSGAAMPRFDYLRDPAEIERQSFTQIRQLTDLSLFDADQQQVAMRLEEER
jgi:hypothetical protein